MQEGKTYFSTRLEYSDSADLADKLRQIADSLDGDKAMLVDKPKWVDEIGTNHGGGGGP